MLELFHVWLQDHWMSQVLLNTFWSSYFIHQLRSRGFLAGNSIVLHYERHENWARVWFKNMKRFWRLSQTWKPQAFFLFNYLMWTECEDNVVNRQQEADDDFVRSCWLWCLLRKCTSSASVMPWEDSKSLWAAVAWGSWTNGKPLWGLRCR